MHHAEQIKRIWKESSGRYGVRKVWQKLKREGYIIARCTVARLMQKLGIQGVGVVRINKLPVAEMIKNEQMTW